MNESKDTFYLNEPEPIKGCLLALRDLILRHDANISETVKYGMPCFVYGKKALCYLWADKKTHEPYILMVEGNQLNHPNLEQGDRKRMKILRIDPNDDLPVEIIGEVLDLGIRILVKNE